MKRSNAAMQAEQASCSDVSSEESEEENDLTLEAPPVPMAKGKGKAKDEETLNVDFGFSDPCEEHFHSIRQLLNSYFPFSEETHFDLSGFVNLIVAQVEAGTMVCIDEEPDVYGFITPLSFDRYKDDKSIQQIQEGLLAKCNDDNHSKALQKAFDSKKVALLVSERMVNLPYQLIPPMYNSFYEDLDWAIKNEKNQNFDFEYFILLSTCTIPKKKQKKGAKVAKVNFNEKIFSNFEDEFLEQEADLSFSFEVPNHTATDSSKCCTVMLIDAKKHQENVKNISSMLVA